MLHTPKRVRTAQSGACSHCVQRKERCYIGVKGIPCTTCDRLKLECDGRINAHQISQSKERTPSLTYCAEGLFASQLQKTEREQRTRLTTPPPVLASEHLDNYLSIIDQLLGPHQGSNPPTVDIPDYVTTLPERLDAADAQYIGAKGALCLPTARFRTELLKSYILWVHPQVPILDLKSFLGAIAVNNGINAISLLLFHAVMFAGVAFVDISYIHQEGYTSRKAARDSLFQRAKVLLELDCENDRLATVQALLLLVHWQDVRNTEKDASHMIGICLSLAVSIGLHRSPEKSSLAPRDKQVWKRTWWSLYNHARLTSEDMLSMMTIEGEHHVSAAPEVPMITMGDFPLEVMAPEIRGVVDDCEVLRCPEKQTIQALLFIEKTKLCRLSQFSSFSNAVRNSILAPDDAAARVCPKLPGLFAKRNLDELGAWYKCLSSTVRHSVPVSLIPTVWERSLYLHRTWLKLLYVGSSYAAVQRDIEQINDTLIFPFMTSYSTTLERYLVDITDLFEEIYSLDLSCFLPAPAVALVALALAYHRQSLEMRAGESQKSSIKLHQCWNIMRQLRDVSLLAMGMDVLLTGSASEYHWERLTTSFFVK